MRGSTRSSSFRVAAVGLCVAAGLAARAAAAPKPERAPAGKPGNAEKAPKAAPKKFLAEDRVPYPPTLPGGQAMVTDTSPEFLKPPATLKDGVAVAELPPTVDFAYYPGQDYPGKPWSNWGDGLAIGGKYYSAIGDHLAIGAKGDGTHGTGRALLYEYDPATKAVRVLADTTRVLGLPAGHYTPGKIHSRIDMGGDGRLYFATHRGSEKAASDVNNYLGDWIMRADPATGEAEVVVRGPVPKHSTPGSVLDPERMIFYGATAAGPDAADQGIWFYAYDLRNRKLLYSGPGGPSRYMILAKSTGRVYFVPDNKEGQLMRYDPAAGGPPVKVEGATIGIRAASQETPQGLVYTVSSGQGAADAKVWSFDTRTEAVKEIGTAAVGAEAYVASVDADPTGRYLYYAPGAHGGGPRDNTPVVQFDVRTGRKKVIAFLHPFYEARYGGALRGTYASAMDPAGAGDKLYVTWNVSRGTKAWDCCALTVIHIPESERP
jgi:hypothetical protein